MELKLKDKWELLALHRTLFEAKYNESPNDLDVQGSPFVKNICDKVFNLILEHLEKENNVQEIKEWQEWIKLENHQHRIDNLKKRLKMIHKNNWPKSEKEQINYIHCLASPLIPNSEEIKELIQYANSIHVNR